MKEFSYSKADSVRTAVDAISRTPNARPLGGGTNLVDLMREEIEQPDVLVDVTDLPARGVEEFGDGGVTIPAALKNAAVADSPVIRERFPVLSRAVVCGASGQIRNMATVGGNLMQRTRCLYFYDSASRCNKRAPGSGCDALEGFNRMHAVLGASEHCVATHPSDMCVALAALDAIVHVEGRDGARALRFDDLHRLPGDTPDVDTALRADELITAVEIPALPFARNSLYRKVRDRSSYAFALVSVAAALELDGDRVEHARVALGGVAHKPWRAFEAERVLLGGEAATETFAQAAEAELAQARPLAHNGFKVELARRTIVGALEELTQTGGAR